MRTIRVLPVDEFIRGGGHEIRVAEPLHDEERLSVSNHPVFRQPRTETRFVVQPLLLDPSIPGRDTLPRPFLEESFGHGPHPFPISNVRQRRLPLKSCVSRTTTSVKKIVFRRSSGVGNIPPCRIMGRLREPAGPRRPAPPPRPRSPRPTIRTPSC